MPEQNATPTVDAILADPKAHGFEFFTDAVEKDGRKFPDAQLVRHLDFDLLRKTFGDALFLNSMDGTSRHVTNQRINRDAWWNALGENPSRKVTKDELQRLVVENMLGMKSARRRTVVVETKFSLMMPDNTFQTFDSKEEAIAAYNKAKAELQA